MNSVIQHKDIIEKEHATHEENIEKKNPSKFHTSFSWHNKSILKCLLGRNSRNVKREADR